MAGAAALPAELRLLGSLRMSHRHRYRNGAPCACGRVRDEANAARGARNRSRGNAIEARVMSELGAQRLGQHGIAEDGLSEHFVIQVKSRKTAAFPGWLANELELLNTIWSERERMALVVVIEAPGPGKGPARKIAVLKYDDAVTLARHLKELNDGKQ